jgi:SAM-dependent methyltransferase
MERHRLVWLYLRERTALLRAPHRLLHVAPEAVFHRRLSALPTLDYVTADLASPLARDRVDVASLPYPDDHFDAILCNHVLEHVPDDRRALRELYRVLRPGGWAILQVPIQKGRAATYEDPAITDPGDRRRAFGQEDHLRIYGRDYQARLAEAGFRVRRDPFVRTLPEAEVARMGLKREDVFRCEKPGATDDATWPESARPRDAS